MQYLQWLISAPEVLLSFLMAKEMSWSTQHMSPIPVHTGGYEHWGKIPFLSCCCLRVTMFTTQSSWRWVQARSASFTLPYCTVRAFTCKSEGCRGFICLSSWWRRMHRGPGDALRSLGFGVSVASSTRPAFLLNHGCSASKCDSAINP